jgi:uncharacterized protein YdeI (YjbR/CyaY-like superfamily)
MRYRRSTMRLHFTERAAWRQWLEEHHDRQREVWLEFWKKHTGRRSLSYDEAVEEALCFGWIDSLIRRIDEKRYERKFTVRTDPGKWSKLNLERVRRMEAAGRMTDAGRAVVAPEAEAGEAAASRKAEMPAELERALTGNDAARAFFEGLAPSYRRNFMLWVGAAKRPETRERRAREAVDLLERGEKLGMK